jgi:hypothetical protein
MAGIEWIPARQLREHYVDPIATDYRMRGGGCIW